ncbi:hypothetical protein ACFL1Q_02925 [Patescibacteria group bacterium]
MTEESTVEKHEQWEKEHRQLVESGEFDKLPQPSIKPRDVVAVRKNGLIHEVFDVTGDSILVGYNKKNGEEIRDVLPISDVKGAEEYQNLLIRNRGMGHLRRVTVEGRTARLQDKTKDN